MKILKNKSNKLSRQKIIKIVISILCVALIGGGFYMGFSVFQQIKDFDIKNLTATSTSRVLDANGNVIYKFGTAAGEYVKYDELPEVLVDAVGVDDAAAAQGDAGLGGQEGGVLVLNGQTVQLAQIAGTEGGDDGLGILRVYMDQAADQFLVLIPDVHNRLQKAHTDAASDPKGEIFAGLEEGLELVIYFACAGGDAAAALSHDDFQLLHTARPSFRW